MGRANRGVALDAFTAVMGQTRGSRELFYGVNLGMFNISPMSDEAKAAVEKLLSQARRGRFGETVIEFQHRQDSEAVAYLRDGLAFIPAETATAEIRSKYTKAAGLPDLEEDGWQEVIAETQEGIRYAMIRPFLQPKDAISILAASAKAGSNVALCRIAAKKMMSVTESEKTATHSAYADPFDPLITEATKQLGAVVLFDLLSEANWREVIKERLMNSGYGKRKYTSLLRDQVKKNYPAISLAVQQQKKTSDEKHSSIMGANLLREQMKVKGINAKQIAQQTGMTNSLVRKILMRSSKERSEYNSGNIARSENMQKVCRILGVDWAVVQLASMTTEMVNGEDVGNKKGRKYRTSTGQLLTKRYNTAQSCLAELRRQPDKRDLAMAIDDIVEGRDLPSSSDAEQEWQAPFRALIAIERTRLGL
jgi:hypothetical protein